jgi:hypothetical protein
MSMTMGRKHSHRWQGVKVTGRTLDVDLPEPGDPIIVNCHHADQGLCENCGIDFAKILMDVPYVYDDLEVEIGRLVRRVERGTIRGLKSDESPQQGGGNPHVAAQQRLMTAIMGDGTDAHPGFSDWVDDLPLWEMCDQLRANLSRVLGEERMPTLARDISSAVSRAHKTIDLHRDLFFYGPCPDCGKDLWQVRIQQHDVETKIVCHAVLPASGGGFEKCGYKAHLDEHQKRILDKAEDHLMTVAELVGALDYGGVPVTRDQNNGWIRRRRLLERESFKLRWNEETGEVEKIPEVRYRLGDARVLAAEANARKTKGDH